MTGRLKALLLLTLAVLRTLVGRLFGLRRIGVRAFVNNYAADGLSEVTAEQRGQIARFGRCIACGLCDRGEAQRIARSEGAYVGVMHIVLAASRSMPDFGAAALGLAHVPEEVLVEKERICPTDVPIVEIARFVRDKADQARLSLPAAAARGELRAGR